MALIDTPGGRIRLARMERGLKSGEMVTEINRRGYSISNSHYSNIEQGSRQLAGELAAIVANILDITTDEIYGRETDIDDSELGDIIDIYTEAEPAIRSTLAKIARMIAGLTAERRKMVERLIEDIEEMEQDERALFVQTMVSIAEMDEDAALLIAHTASVLQKIDQERRYLQNENTALLVRKLSGGAASVSSFGGDRVDPPTLGNSN